MWRVAGCAARRAHSWVAIPKLSPTMSTGRVLRWHKRPGDAVSPGDLLMDVGCGSDFWDPCAGGPGHGHGHGQGEGEGEGEGDDAVVMHVEAHDQGFLASIYAGGVVGGGMEAVGSVVGLMVEDAAELEDAAALEAAAAGPRPDPGAVVRREVRTVAWQAFFTSDGPGNPATGGMCSPSSS